MMYSWRRQHRVDRSLEAGLTTAEKAELVAARKRIQELEPELAVHRRAAELLNGTAHPKAGSRPSRRWSPRFSPRSRRAASSTCRSPGSTPGDHEHRRSERSATHGSPIGSA